MATAIVKINTTTGISPTYVYSTGASTGATNYDVMVDFDNSALDRALGHWAGSQASGFLALSTFPNVPTAVRCMVKNRATGWTNDTGTLSVRLFKSDGLTVLTNDVVVSTLASGVNHADRTETVTMTGLVAATLAEWDGALAKYTWTHASNMGADGGTPLFLVDALQFEIDYTPLVPFNQVAFGFNHDRNAWNPYDAQDTNIVLGMES